MLPLKTILYLFLIMLSIAGSIFYHPLIGLLGYLVTYQINPTGQWWGASLPGFLSRYSMLLGAATVIGAIVHRRKLKFDKILKSQEKLLIAFVAITWLSKPLGIPYQGLDMHIMKMTKIAVILVTASLILTDLKRYEAVVYIYLIAGLMLGLQTYHAPHAYFSWGRLEGGVGGSDLANGNMLAAHFLVVLSFAAVMFLQKGWKTKTLCILAAAFMLNAIVLIQSRGSFLGVAVAAVSALLFAKKVNRKKIFLCLLAGGIAATVLVNKGFIKRMKLMDVSSESRLDYSAQERLIAWKAAVQMALDHPFGVGTGRFRFYVGKYAPDIAGLDTHNTYLRCWAELGYPGILVLFLLIFNAFRILLGVSRKVDTLSTPNKSAYYWHIYAVKIGLLAFLVAVTFVSATYTEAFYWLLMFPVFLDRSVDNELSKNMSPVLQSGVT